MFAPTDTYRSPALQEHAAGWIQALGRAALIALVIGTSMAVAATGRVTLRLVLSETLCWSFAPLLQIVAGAAVLATAPRRGRTLATRLDLLFMGHAPWSIWLIAAAVWAAIAPATSPFEGTVPLTSVVPAAWTAWIVFAFCANVLQLAPRRAALSTLLHQAIIWTMLITYTAVVTQAWPRVLAIMGR